MKSKAEDMTEEQARMVVDFLDDAAQKVIGVWWFVIRILVGFARAIRASARTRSKS